jgi:GNAT superfamily N-acetyltransferase
VNGATQRGPAGLVIRDARPDEKVSLARFTLRAYAEYASIMEPEAWAGLRDAVEGALEHPGDAQRIVARLDDRVVGTVMLYPPHTESYGGELDALGWPEVRLLAVDPHHRGRGIGRALMEECITRARAAGASRLGLHTSRSMVAAIEMYRAMGFVRTPELDFRPPGAELVEAHVLDL